MVKIVSVSCLMIKKAYMKDSNSLILTEKMHFAMPHFATASQYLSDIQPITVTGRVLKLFFGKASK